MSKGYRVVVWVAAAISAFLGLWLLFPAPSTQANNSTGVPQWVEFQLSPLGQNGTDMSENFVVWSDYAGHPYDPFPLADTCLNDYPPSNSLLPPDGRAAICLYDLTTGTVMSLTNATAYDYLPRTDGSWVVFRRHYSPADLVAFNLLTGEEMIVFDRNNLGLFVLEYSHQVDQGFVVATGLLPLGTSHVVTVHEIAGGQNTIVTQSSSTQPGHADIAYPYVVWHEIGPTGGMDVMGYDLTTQTTFTISVQMPHEGYARIEGTTVVWEREGDIVGYDIAAATPFTVTQDVYQQREPAISERWIVWQDDRHGQWEIYAYDRFDGQTYRVTNHPSNDQHPAVAGDIITWERSGTTPEGVYAAWLMYEFSFLPFIFRP